jgi:hypothetical protein
MQKHDMAEKVKIFSDGQELPGLVNFGETVVEKGVVEVPEFHKIRNISNGMEKVPIIECTFKISRGSPILKILRDWYYKDEDHDLSKVRTDAHGIEFARSMYPGCECLKYHEPAFDGMSPTYAQIQTKFACWDFFPVE